MAKYRISWGIADEEQATEMIEAANDAEALDVARGLALSLVSYSIERLTPLSGPEISRLQTTAMQALLELQRADQAMFEKLMRVMGQ